MVLFILFLFIYEYNRMVSAQKHRFGYSLEPPRRGGSNEYPQSMFWAEIWKILEFFYLKIFILWW